MVIPRAICLEEVNGSKNLKLNKTVSEEWISKTNGQVGSITLGDVKGDGTLEVIVTETKSEGGAQVQVFNGEDGSEIWSHDISLGKEAVVSDIDGDDLPEVIIGSVALNWMPFSLTFTSNSLFLGVYLVSFPKKFLVFH